MKKIIIVLSLITILLLPLSSYSQNKNDIPLNLSIHSQQDKYLQDEIFDIEYTISPEPIKVEEIYETELKKKEIILVMDYSGSMNEKIANGKSKDQKMKTVAKNFIEKLKGDERVSITFVPYESRAYTKTYNGNYFVNMTDENNLNMLIDDIEYKSPKGGTNLGDGLRHGYYNFKNNGNENSLKYIITMTDGEPTFYSYKGWFLWRDFYTGESLSNYNINNFNDFNNGSKYAELITESLIKENNYNIYSYMIGFGNDVDEIELEKLSNIAKGQYIFAKDGNALDKVYQNIASFIEADIPINNISFEEKLPQGIEPIEQELPQGLKYDKVNNKITGILNEGIAYKLDDKEEKYIASDINIKIKYKATNLGNYILGGKNSKISFKGLEDDINIYNFPEKKLEIESGISDIDLTQIGVFINNDTKNEVKDYIDGTENNSINIAKSFETSIGILFNTSNMKNNNTNIKISFISNDNYINIKEIGDISFELYKYDEINKKIYKIEDGLKVNLENNIYKITPNITNNNLSGDFILTYKFKAKDIIDNDIIFTNKNIFNNEKEIDINIKIVKIPELD